LAVRLTAILQAEVRELVRLRVEHEICGIHSRAIGGLNRLRED
jgi:hypothetical protein